MANDSEHPEGDDTAAGPADPQRLDTPAGITAAEWAS